MRLWIMSDLHVELTRGWDLPSPAERPDFDVLIVAGDLIPKMERGVKWLRERVPDRPVIYVPGNHEFYGTDEIRTVEKAKEAAAGSDVHVLQNEAVRIGAVRFAGATLWTDFAINGDAHRAMAVAGDRMNDFKKIRTAAYRERFLPHHALTRHLKSRAFLKAELRKPRAEGKLVVVTHHAPIPGMSHEAGRSGNDPSLAPAYRSDLRMLMSASPDDGRGALRPADLWIHGHTHESFDAVIGATRVVSNGKGYGPWLPREQAWDNPHFDPNFIVEV
ncbi:metallophosphoesterase [Bradyrhizobium sp. USDA 10063]